jgi:hypothetical protein
MNLIHLTQDKDRWRPLVNTIMNHKVPKNVGYYLNRCTSGGFSIRA